MTKVFTRKLENQSARLCRSMLYFKLIESFYDNTAKTKVTSDYLITNCNYLKDRVPNSWPKSEIACNRKQGRAWCRMPPVLQDNCHSFHAQPDHRHLTPGQYIPLSEDIILSIKKQESLMRKLGCIIAFTLFLFELLLYSWFAAPCLRYISANILSVSIIEINKCLNQWPDKRCLCKWKLQFKMVICQNFEDEAIKPVLRQICLVMNVKRKLGYER